MGLAGWRFSVWVEGFRRPSIHGKVAAEVLEVKADGYGPGLLWRSQACGLNQGPATLNLSFRRSGVGARGFRVLGFRGGFGGLGFRVWGLRI